jgi:dTDP-4-amino-4,6-dideoxy-D-galactose acyltransferase
VNKYYQLLSWDSDFFGFIVARIMPYRLTVSELKSMLDSLKNENVSLVYWASDPEDQESQEGARRLGGFLADRKVTYAIDLELGPQDLLVAAASRIEEYAEPTTTADLEHLAIQSGLFSRYNVDPRISKEQFERLYRHWIRKSVNRTLADTVFVAREGQRIVGMVTVVIKHGQGAIGLISVDERVRRKNIGVNLVRTAQRWAIESGCRHVQVVTQGDNIAGCRMYEKCGFHIKKIEYFYHFWL